MNDKERATALAAAREEYRKAHEPPPNQSYTGWLYLADVVADDSLWSWRFEKGDRSQYVIYADPATEDGILLFATIFDAFEVKPNVNTDLLIGERIWAEIGYQGEIDELKPRKDDF